MNPLFKYSQEIASSLNILQPNAFDNVQSLELDCRNLPQRGSEGNCFFHPTTSEFFKPLLEVSGPALYWFHVLSNHTAKDFLEMIPTLKKDIDRNVPAYKKGFCNWQSKVLYVGKVKSNISGRMVVHLGYYTNPNTQGLQLCYWAQSLNLKVRLNYIILPEALKEMAGLFERKLASNLCPILGKHK